MEPMHRQAVVIAGALMATFSTGAGMGFPSVLLHQLKRNDSEIPIDIDSSSWIGSIHGLSGIPAIVAPVIMQWRGRKFTFISACLLIIIDWSIAYTANGIEMIYTSESIHGFGINVLNIVCFDYLTEVIPPTHRNIVVQTYGVVHLCGLVLPGILSNFLHWRTICIIFGSPVIISLLTALTWLESPLWLAYKNDLDICKANFVKIRGNDAKSVKELTEVLAAHNEKMRMNKALKAENVLRRFSRQTTRRDFVMPALHTFLLLNVCYWSGSTVLLIYSLDLISQTTQNETAKLVGGIMMNFFFILGTIIILVLLRFFNNKTIFLWTNVSATICLVSVSVVSYLQSVGILGDSVIILGFLVAYMTFNGSTLCYTMTCELMPVKHRGLGGALYAIYVCLLHASSMKISPYLFSYLGMWGTFLIYATNSIVCGILIQKYVPEARGRTLQELENYYTYGTFNRELLPEESERFDVKYHIGDSKELDQL